MVKNGILSILALIVFIFSACDNGGNLPQEEEPDYKFSIAGTSPSYVSAKVNIISSNLSKLAYIVLPQSADTQQEFTAEYLFTNCTVVNCSTTGKRCLFCAMAATRSQRVSPATTTCSIPSSLSNTFEASFCTKSVVYLAYGVWVILMQPSGFIMVW